MAKKALTQTDFVNALAKKNPTIPKSQIKELLASQADVVADNMDAGVTVPGVAKFVKHRRKARDGRNPATGEKIRIAAKTVPKARILKALKDRI